MCSSTTSAARSLEAALARLARGARIVHLRRRLAVQRHRGGRGPANYMQLLVARASMTGFVIFDYADRYAEGVAQLAQWLRSGELRSREDVVARRRQRISPTSCSALPRREHRQAGPRALILSRQDAGRFRLQSKDASRCVSPGSSCISKTFSSAVVLAYIPASDMRSTRNGTRATT